jgi:hypothetical protein
MQFLVCCRVKYSPDIRNCRAKVMGLSAPVLSRANQYCCPLGSGFRLTYVW